MSNYTSLIDDIENLTVPTSSDDPFPSPADPFEDYVNVTDYTIIEIKNKNGTESVRLFEYFSEFCNFFCKKKILFYFRKKHYSSENFRVRKKLPTIKL